MLDWDRSQFARENDCPQRERDMVAAAFHDVHKTYSTSMIGRSGVAAVRGVSLIIPTGRVFALLGPNRAGKTTLVKLLLSLTKLSSGRIERLGEPIAHRATLGRVGYMHENHAFPRYLSPLDVLTFYGGLSGLSTEELPVKANRLLERVGLADRRHDAISRFSKGMVQRLGLAQALMNDPELLILDEPTEGLDLMGRKLLREVVRELRATGKTVVFVSHVLPEVEELCDEAAVIVGGKIAATGTIPELCQGRSFEAALQGLYEQGAAA